MKNELVRQHTQTPSVSPESSSEAPVQVPAVDIVEGPESWTLIADMPGVDEKNLEVTVERDTLTLRGQVDASQKGGYRLDYQEYGLGHFERKFTLSGEVDRQAMEATIKHGVLRVKLPKAATARLRRIPVQAE